jgi:hypothetical protein
MIFSVLGTCVSAVKMHVCRALAFSMQHLARSFQMHLQYGKGRYRKVMARDLLPLVQKAHRPAGERTRS